MTEDRSHTSSNIVLGRGGSCARFCKNVQQLSPSLQKSCSTTRSSCSRLCNNALRVCGRWGIGTTAPHGHYNVKHKLPSPPCCDSRLTERSQSMRSRLVRKEQHVWHFVLGIDGRRPYQAPRNRRESPRKPGSRPFPTGRKLRLWPCGDGPLTGRLQIAHWRSLWRFPWRGMP